MPSHLLLLRHITHHLTILLLLLITPPTTQSFSTKPPPPKPLLQNLNIAVVGAGPSGLLLTHRLLSAGNDDSHTKVTLYDSRSDPRSLHASSSRAYALGIGIRGRTAIRTVDEELWSAVKRVGFECDKFRLHVNDKVGVQLRDDERQRMTTTGDLEPSVLLYQSDLCAALLEDLERRFGDGSREEGGGRRLNVRWGSGVTEVDTRDGNVVRCDARDGSTTTTEERYDLVVGCDGFNSAVRRSVEKQSPRGTFASEVEKLPGVYKAVTCSFMPPKLDPGSIHLVLAGKGSGVEDELSWIRNAFVEPTANGTACILFAGSSAPDSVSSLLDEGAVGRLSDELAKRFPLLEGLDMEDMTRQLLRRNAGSASSVKCNIYHYEAVALCGDAAHATGGVSGQGCNSALIDATVLVDCLTRFYDPKDKAASIRAALEEYSCRQVPEGNALYDLSFGDKSLSIWRRVLVSLYNLVDTLFGGRFGMGKPMLQTILGQTLKPFAEIRRDREWAYEDDFPTQEEWEKKLKNIYK